MAPEGMVHALSETQRLLRPGGILLDIQPLPQAMLYEVRRGEAVLHSRPEPGFCPDNSHHARKAVNDVIRRGLFAPRSGRRFDFIVSASSVAELRAYLDEVNAFEKEPGGRAGEDMERLDASLEEALRLAGAGARVAAREVADAARLVAVP
jgi:hypothetical protein